MNNGIVYKIRNLVNNKVYIGSTTNQKHRKYTHFYLLKNGCHHSKHLQGAFDLYGKKNFVFEVIESGLTTEEALNREQFWIDHHQSYNDAYGYNISLDTTAPMSGRKHTEETLKKVSEASINWHKINKGTEKYCQYLRNLSESLDGHYVSEETKKKISEAAKRRTGERNPFYGRSHSEETKRILSEQRKGTRQPDELNKKRSETLKKKKVNQGTKNRGAKLTEEQVIEIRKRLASGERIIDLATEYGLSKSSIANIKSGASWKHLPVVV